MIDHPPPSSKKAGQLPAMLDALPGLLACWDPDLRSIPASKACLEYSGLTPGQMVGMRVRDVSGEATYAANGQCVNRAPRGGRPQSGRAVTGSPARPGMARPAASRTSTTTAFSSSSPAALT